MPAPRTTSSPGSWRSSASTSMLPAVSIASRSSTLTAASTSDWGCSWRVAVTTTVSPVVTGWPCNGKAANDMAANRQERSRVIATHSGQVGTTLRQPADNLPGRARGSPSGSPASPTATPRSPAHAVGAPVLQAGLRAGRVESAIPGRSSFPAIGQWLFEANLDLPPAYRCGGSAGIPPASRAPEAGESLTAAMAEFAAGCGRVRHFAAPYALVSAAGSWMPRQTMRHDEGGASMRLTLATLLESSARRYPDKPALRAAGVELSYAQLHASARRAAQVLADANIRRGGRVALMCFNTPGFVIAAFAAWRLGAAVVPLNHKLAAPEVDYVLRHCKADLVICDGTLAALVGQVATMPVWTTDSQAEGCVDFDARVALAAEFQADLAQEDDLAEVLYTSGTTGKPKGCMHDHRGLSLVAAYSSAVVPMRHDDRSLIAMPIWHASPLNNWLLGGLFIGATMVLLREYQPRAFLQTIQDERITLYFGAPVSFLAPLQLVEDFSAFDLTSIRAFIYGAGPIGAQTARMLQNAYRCDDFFQVYGMTETGPSGTILYPEEQIERAGSCGRSTLPGIDRRVVKADGREAGPGEVGEVWFRAVTMMRGYL